MKKALLQIFISLLLISGLSACAEVEINPRDGEEITSEIDPD